MNPGEAFLWLLVCMFGLVVLFAVFLLCWFILDVLRGKR